MARTLCFGIINSILVKPLCAWSLFHKATSHFHQRFVTRDQFSPHPKVRSRIDRAAPLLGSVCIASRSFIVIGRY